MNKQETHEPENEGINSDSENYNLREWRRDKVWELRAKGYSISAIVEELKAGHKDIKISIGTVHNDIKAKQEEIKAAFKEYITVELPSQHRLAVTGLDKVLYEAWKIYDGEQDNKAKLQALNVISETIMRKQQVLGDPEAISKAIKTVAQLKAVIKRDKDDEESGGEEKEEVISTA